MQLRKGSIAIYQQIIEHLEYAVVSRRLNPGERLPSIRDLAVELKVNPNTVQKALAELERNKIIYTDRTNGKFVTEDVEEISRLQKKLMNDLVEEVMYQSKMMNLDRDSFFKILNEKWED